VICTTHQIFCRQIKKKWNGQGMWHVWETEGVHTVLWWGELREIDHLEDLGTDGRFILQWISKKWEGMAWAVLLWLRIGTGGVLFEDLFSFSGRTLLDVVRQSVAYWKPRKWWENGYFKKWDGWAWPGLLWLGTGVKLLWMR
jgi:hypothetical protein